VTRAVYAGSFDPPTLGHLDVIRRGARLCDELVVAVAVNPGKNPWFTVEERMAMLRAVVRDLPNVRVDSLEGLTVAYLDRIGANAILRGVRTYADFEYEFQMAATNREIDPRAETVFVMTDARWIFVNSHLIKEACRLGADVRSFVPPEVWTRLQAKLGGTK